VAPNVMVIGAERDSARVVQTLRARGMAAWSDRLGRAALDIVAIDWADALVVIDTTPHIESRHVRPVIEFPGSTLLATPVPLSAEERADLLDHGFDAVIGWPSHLPVISSYVDRFIARTYARASRRLQA
jgi:hypothetical protein